MFNRIMKNKNEWRVSGCQKGRGRRLSRVKEKKRTKEISLGFRGGKENKRMCLK